MAKAKERRSFSTAATGMAKTAARCLSVGFKFTVIFIGMTVESRLVAEGRICLCRHGAHAHTTQQGGPLCGCAAGTAQHNLDMHNLDMHNLDMHNLDMHAETSHWSLPHVTHTVGEHRCCYLPNFTKEMAPGNEGATEARGTAAHARTHARRLTTPAPVPASISPRHGHQQPGRIMPYTQPGTCKTYPASNCTASVDQPTTCTCMSPLPPPACCLCCSQGCGTTLRPHLRRVPQQRGLTCRVVWATPRIFGLSPLREALLPRACLCACLPSRPGACISARRWLARGTRWKHWPCKWAWHLKLQTPRSRRAQPIFPACHT